jgi:hypothetical protein
MTVEHCQNDYESRIDDIKDSIGKTPDQKPANVLVDHRIHFRIALNPGEPLFQTKKKVGSQAFTLLSIP